MTRLTILLAALALPARLEGQTLAQRVAAVADGTVRRASPPGAASAATAGTTSPS
jgi:hypothetical protein